MALSFILTFLCAKERAIATSHDVFSIINEWRPIEHTRSCKFGESFGFTVAFINDVYLVGGS